MRSSYIKNNYSDVFRAVVRAFNPRVCVELGVLDGYSTIALGESIKELGGHLDAWDLFEDYEFNHGSQAAVQTEIDRKGLSEIVTLHKGSAFEAQEQYSAGSVGLLHVDLSNTGDIFNKIIDLWDPRMVQGGIILFEGGSEERDQEPWMVKYHAKPIKPEIERNKIIEDKYVFGTYLKWPSLTCFLKKRY